MKNKTERKENRLISESYINMHINPLEESFILGIGDSNLHPLIQPFHYLAIFLFSNSIIPMFKI
jgi:hypothetical protein